MSLVDDADMDVFRRAPQSHVYTRVHPCTPWYTVVHRGTPGVHRGTPGVHRVHPCTTHLSQSLHLLSFLSKSILHRAEGGRGSRNFPGRHSLRPPIKPRPQWGMAAKRTAGDTTKIGTESRERPPSSGLEGKGGGMGVLGEGVRDMDLH